MAQVSHIAGSKDRLYSSRMLSEILRMKDDPTDRVEQTIRQLFLEKPALRGQEGEEFRRNCTRVRIMNQTLHNETFAQWLIRLSLSAK